MHRAERSTNLGISKESVPFRFLYLGLIALALALPPADIEAAPLPAALHPPAPFPAITAQTAEREVVAPGVARAAYRLRTAKGPLVVSIVAVDLREPTVRVGAVLAGDRIVSADETLSSMARRTGAVAGINGDYFEINRTGAPVGLLVRDGALIRSPVGRPALVVTRERRVRFARYAFGGVVTSPGLRLPLTGLNAWPPACGASLLNPIFGDVPATPRGLAVLALAPVERGAG
ncbi:MAG: hypothetical protein JOZ24_12825, partial [Candidatus Eremiobacteraeota bacterium]|nr:hypothetical protein [Candidatus Eremiobacteraeota bacterium]